MGVRALFTSPYTNSYVQQTQSSSSTPTKQLSQSQETAFIASEIKHAASPIELMI
jgi:hypothetical protein